jgi:hypothetical protein
MAIVRMISRDLAEFRAFQTRNAEVGRIRIGQYVTPEGKRGRPVKLDRFRLTSTTEDHIRVAAAEYGGEPRPYSPQGGGVQQWEVVTEADALDVWIVNRQIIDPVYEMWGAGRTCTRRCDGEWNTVLQESCLCNDPERRPADPRQLCKITTRVNVMLPRVAGLHSWRLETHSENAAVEMAAPSVAGLVRAAQVPVPATLRLRKELRRERNHDKGTFETKDFYVPWFDLSRIGAQALAGGEEAITAALTGAGAPELLADQRAIGAAPVPVSAVPASTPPARDPVDGTAVLSDGELARILAAVEKADTLDALEKLKTAFAARNVRHPAVFAAWKSKRAAVEAVERLAAEAVNDQFADDLDAAMGGEPEPEAWGPDAFDSEPVVFEDAEREYRVGDTVTVGGIEFTKISDNPFPPGSASAAAYESRLPTPVEGVVEDGPGSHLPTVPEGAAGSATAELSALMAAAGARTPAWTTDKVRRTIVDAFGLKHMGEATGEQYLRVRLALEQGLLDG